VLDEQDRGFEGQVQVGHSWNLAGLADARRHSARDERAALSARARAAALARQLEAAYAWITLRRTESLLAIVHDVAAVARTVADRTGIAASRGVLTEADRAEAEAFAAEADALVLAGEGARVAAQLALARAMGTGEAASLAAVGALPSPSVPEPEQIELALRDVEHRPRVIAARLAATAIRARDAEISAERGARLDADLIVYRESPAGLMIFPQIGVVLPFADMAARERSVIAEEATIADGSAEAMHADALREAHEVAHEVEHARATMSLLQGSLVPALERLATLRRRQLEVSETTVMIALEAERRLLRARAEMATAEADRTWAEVRAWLLLAELDGSRAVDDGEAP
jgi:outer membrane protein TolC